ncbi:MAG: hypothetical protein A2V46_00370 [Bacteroidetes bacterium RBG_19FT_COMBO_42_7]|jgi:hypothetical protein|nr:MAG: hypothetical protein A2Y71_08515 [Bacteroidetes bacterium RBG_13_42_15]OFY77902.1 MAG: hypothetical protein A2V46_00370 [Bacteroidetes bacterium RBG_19FT_COMBO_42_7]
MKKLLISLFAACFAVAQLPAQEPAFVKGNKVINLGVGLGSNLYRESYYNSTIPPVSASFEIGVKDHILERGVIGAGGYLAGSSYKYEFSRKGWKTTNFIVGIRGNFHYPLVDKLDTYSGLMLGYGILSVEYFGGYDDDDYTGSSSGLQWAWFLGGRYYLRESFAAMLELGYGISYLNLGVSFKF